MQIHLRNKYLSVMISGKGAELKSIKSVSDNLEYLWQGSEHSWKRSSPILFPIIGGLNLNQYVFEGKNYAMNSHGFARDENFNILKQSENEVLLSIGETEDSLKIFPFSFQLKIGYKLERKRLSVSYAVINENGKSMLFSIGAHPGFNCPLEDGLSFSDYKLVLDKKEYSDRRLKEGAVLSGERSSFFNGDREINLNHELFHEGALIFDDLVSDTICLISEKSDRRILMNFAGFPYFGIWTWGGSPENFICLEPWFGIDSTKGDPPEWEKKEGLIHLEAGKTFDASYFLEFE